jgi:hypothetical protein
LDISWCDKVTKRFRVYKLGLSHAFEYFCSAPSRKIVKRYLLTLLLLLAFRTGYSQATETVDSLHLPVKPAWLNVGLGRSLNYPLALNLGFSLPLHAYLSTLRFQLTDELDLHRQSASESLWDIGLLLGKMVEKRHTIFIYSAGLGYVGGRIRGKFIPDESGWGGLQKMKKLSSIGIPIEIKYIRTISGNVGIGLTAFGDLNLVRPFGGIALSLHLGQLP